MTESAGNTVRATRAGEKSEGSSSLKKLENEQK